MLTTLRVQNFKAFEDTGMVELQPLTLLSGINSAGKSTLFQALLLLKQTLESSRSAQVLDLSGPFVSSTPDRLLHDDIEIEGQTFEPDKPKPKKSLVYDFYFSYGDANILEKLRAVFSELGSASLTKLVCNLSLRLNWGTFGYLEQPEIRVSDVQITIKFDSWALGLNIYYDISERSYKLRMIKENTSPIFETLALEQLNIDGFNHFLPALFSVTQPQRPDPLRDLSPKFAQFMRQLFQHIAADLAESIYYLSSFRDSPRPTYANPFPADLLEANGSNFAQVLWRYRERKVSFEHPQLPYPNRDRPYIMELYPLVAWILRDLLGLEQSVTIKAVAEGREDILEVVVETLGAKPVSVTLADVGLGYNQILPLVIQGLLTPPGGLVIFEQPEIHLHPDVQAKLILFFIGLAKSGRRVLVETHSSYMIDHLCLAIAQDQGAEDWLAHNASVLFVHPPDQEYPGARIEPVQINPYGDILNYPPHFMPNTAELYEAILRAGYVKRQAQKL